MTGRSQPTGGTPDWSALRGLHGSVIKQLPRIRRSLIAVRVTDCLLRRARSACARLAICACGWRAGHYTASGALRRCPDLCGRLSYSSRSPSFRSFRWLVTGCFIGTAAVTQAVGEQLGLATTNNSAVSFTPSVFAGRGSLRWGEPRAAAAVAVAGQGGLACYAIRRQNLQVLGRRSARLVTRHDQRLCPLEIAAVPESHFQRTA